MIINKNNKKKKIENKKNQIFYNIYRIVYKPTYNKREHVLTKVLELKKASYGENKKIYF